jgi:hypothetical protein
LFDLSCAVSRSYPLRKMYIYMCANIHYLALQ